MAPFAVRRVQHMHATRLDDDKLLIFVVPVLKCARQARFLSTQIITYGSAALVLYPKLYIILDGPACFFLRPFGP